MTKLGEAFDPEPAELISAGFISECGKCFYAENATTLAHPEIQSDWVKDNVQQLAGFNGCEIMVSSAGYYSFDTQYECSEVDHLQTFD